ncbi:hypothetical protein SAMN04487905_101528 [Actinopolyspora xinjiangensis]|uniref:Uncharacterized protein n=1 Tax=Actinopolyspora xinjiangensis TaxID=405564 RepID=A0A1H0PGK3_9ACTN|nr:hypothetical protein [Actinopolyspora xinjiangensis]SDP03765.1 hypothetical protein SAMN04487905_101528 [Actinopolyspora xinjiangensis]
MRSLTARRLLTALVLGPALVAASSPALAAPDQAGEVAAAPEKKRVYFDAAGVQKGNNRIWTGVHPYADGWHENGTAKMRIEGTLWGDCSWADAEVWVKVEWKNVLEQNWEKAADIPCRQLRKDPVHHYDHGKWYDHTSQKEANNPPKKVAFQLCLNPTFGKTECSPEQGRWFSD